MTIISGSEDLKCMGEQKSGGVQGPPHRFGWGVKLGVTCKHEQQTNVLESYKFEFKFRYFL